VRLKRNAAGNLREKEAIRPNMISRGENVRVSENEIGALKAI